MVHWIHYILLQNGNKRSQPNTKSYNCLNFVCFSGEDSSPENLLLHGPFSRKPKRIRTAFSPSQLLRLERAFEKNHYVVGAERKQLASGLCLTETQVRHLGNRGRGAWGGGSDKMFVMVNTKVRQKKADSTELKSWSNRSALKQPYLFYNSLFIIILYCLFIINMFFFCCFWCFFVTDSLSKRNNWIPFLELNMLRRFWQMENKILVQTVTDNSGNNEPVGHINHCRYDWYFSEQIKKWGLANQSGLLSLALSSAWVCLLPK